MNSGLRAFCGEFKLLDPDQLPVPDLKNKCVVPNPATCPAFRLPDPYQRMLGHASFLIEKPYALDSRIGRAKVKSLCILAIVQLNSIVVELILQIAKVHAPQELRRDRVLENLVVDMDIAGLNLSALKWKCAKAGCNQATSKHNFHLKPLYSMLRM